MLQWFFAAPLSRQQTFALLVAAALHAVIASLLPCIVRPDCRDRRMPVASPCRSLRPCPALRSRPCFASGSTREDRDSSVPLLHEGTLYLLLHPERPYSIQRLCPFPSKRAQRSVRDLVLILHRLAGSLTRSRCRRRGDPVGRSGRRRRQWWRRWRGCRPRSCSTSGRSGT
jgi:hypothetical protein